MKRYIGLDVHKEFTCCCEMDSNGKILREFRFPSSPAGIAAYASTLTCQDEVALESTTNSLAFAKVLQKKAGRVVISNPMQTKAIAWARVKTDKVDARVLAQLLRAGFLPEVWQPDEETESRRRYVAYREALTRTTTQVKNRIHAILYRNLVEVKGVSDLFSKKGLELLDKLRRELPEDEAWQMKMELELLSDVNRHLETVEKALAKDAVKDSKVRLLMSIPGISDTVALSLVSAIGPIDRFPSAKKLVSYFGLNPRVSQTSKHCWTGSISKCGRSNARWLLVEASQMAVRSPGPLQAFFQRIERKKGYGVAIVAVARKLTYLVWQMLRTGEVYRWSSPIRTQEKLRKLELKAGHPKMTGRSRGQFPVAAREAQRRLDQDLARQAQAQYAEMVRYWQKTNPEKKARSEETKIQK